jgi:hypothetical protein
MPKDRFRFLPFLPLGAAALVASAGLLAQAPADLVPEGPRPDLFLVSTGDVVGYLEPCG